MSPYGKRGDMIVHEEDPYNAEPPPGALAGQPLTPVDAFYCRNHGRVPELDPGTWQLTVTGLVERPLRLSLAQLRERFPVATVTATLQCAGNRRAQLAAVRAIPGEDPWRDGAISTAQWSGVRLADVLAAAGPRPGAAHAEFLAPDVSALADPPQPFGGSIPVGKGLRPEVLLAWEMNGQPLPAVHGGPVRVVVPGFIGARSVKWVHHITVRADPSANYFQATAYRLLPASASQADAGPGRGTELGPVPLNCAILSPADGSAVAPGAVTVTGYALAGAGHALAGVEVSGDGGRSWQAAELDGALGDYAWRLWRARITVAASGVLEVVARARDSAGCTQPDSPAAVWNPKGYANNSQPRIRLPIRPGQA